MIGLIDVGYKNSKKLEQLLDEYIDVETIGIYDFKPDHLKDWKGIVISSSQIVVNEQNINPYIEKLQPILTANLPVLGIGTGHHLLGILYGAQPSYQPYFCDYHIISVLEDSPIFDRLSNEIELYSDHASSVSIPPNFKLIASSDKSINEAMEHKEKKIYGVQFLPELSGNFGAIIVENFIHQVDNS